jgi:nucleoside-diphosphate kinase
MEDRLEKSLVLVKPDGVQRGLVGEIITRFERRGLKLTAAKFIQVPVELAEAHYAVHKGKDFYQSLIEYITSGPVMAMVWEGPNAIVLIRQTVGSTRPHESAPGTIRHDFAIHVQRNLVHASDSPANGEQEAALWFKPEELVDWNRTIDPWLFI